MPFYVIILTTGAGKSCEQIFEANDDAHAAIEYTGRIPAHLRGGQYQLSYQRCEFNALEHLPRMARPQLGCPSYIGISGHGPLYIMEENGQKPLPHNPGSLSSSVNQLSILVSGLRDTFRSIEPDQNNMTAYGHTIRNTLLIAAMEFENECKGVMSAHGYIPAGNASRWNTSDFVKILQPLRLAEYEVSFSHYPNIQSRKPFSSWNIQAPTQSLSWYDAYNSVKHDREANFSRATIENAIDAVSACAVMLAAQYRVIPNWRDQIGDFFAFDKHPDWLSEHQYINIVRPNHPGQWTPKIYSF